MKNNKLTTRIFSLIMAVVVICAFSTTAFAAETPDNTVINDSLTSTSVGEKTIPAWGSSKFYYEKISLISATINVSTSSSSSQGAIIVTAFNSNAPDVELSDDWVMGTNDFASWKFLTLAGTIVIEVSNHSSEPVTVRVWF